jgi:hypothetical protein
MVPTEFMRLQQSSDREASATKRIRHESGTEGAGGTG